MDLAAALRPISQNIAGVIAREDEVRECAFLPAGYPPQSIQRGSTAKRRVMIEK